MTSKADPMRNVGTPEHPVSWLHERTVAVLYDELTHDRVFPPGGNNSFTYDKSLKVRLTPGSNLSHDLREGVTSVRIPDPEWDIIGGIIPDIALYGEDSPRPIRVIEVIVSHPPNAAKRQKIEKLKERGVDVVEIVVKSEEHLRNLLEVTWKPKFRKVVKTHRVDDKVIELIENLQMCSPIIRRVFKQMLDELDTIDSLYPFSSANPLREKLEDNQV